jgi:hypothetical protein
MEFETVMVGKWKSTTVPILLFIAVLFTLFITSTSLVNANAASPIDNKKQEKVLNVKMPDGIYLYYSTLGNLQVNKVSPLIIVKNGRLLNPYEIADKMNTQEMMKKYSVSKTFAVVRGSEKIGEISNVEFESYYCLEKPRNHKQKILPVIKGEGKYSGKTITSSLRNSKLPFGFTNIIITPPSFNPDIGSKIFELTEDYKKKILAECREKFLPIILEEQSKKLAKRGRQIKEENKSRIFAADAVDLNGTGKTDYIGLYNVSFKVTEGIRSVGLAGDEVPFILWHDGKIERIDEGKSAVGFMYINAIDIDGDGIKELFVQKIIPIEKIGDDGAIDTFQIEILKHQSSGWKSIWHSGLICGPSSFYYQ